MSQTLNLTNGFGGLVGALGQQDYTMQSVFEPLLSHQRQFGAPYILL